MPETQAFNTKKIIKNSVVCVDCAFSVKKNELKKDLTQKMQGAQKSQAFNIEKKDIKK